MVQMATITGIDYCPFAITVAESMAAKRNISNVHFMKESADTFGSGTPNQFGVTCFL